MRGTVLRASGEGVEDFLHVIVLLETVDQRQHLGGLLLRELRRYRADVFVLGGERSDAARLERLLQPAEIGERAADHQLRLTFLAGALAHLVESMIDEVQLEVVLVQALWVQAEHAHLAEHEAHTAVGGEIAAALGDEVAHGRHRACRIVRGGLHQERNAVRRVTLVEHLLVTGSVTPRGALDRRFDLVLRHVDGARVLDDAPQARICARVGPPGLDGHGDVLRDAGELLRHAVPPREHRVLADFEDAAHAVHGARSAQAVPATAGSGDTGSWPLERPRRRRATRVAPAARACAAAAGSGAARSHAGSVAVAPGPTARARRAFSHRATAP